MPPLTLHRQFTPERLLSKPQITLRKQWEQEYYPISTASQDVSCGIPRPPGELSRLKRGGFSLKATLNWDQTFMRAVQHFVRDQVKTNLDRSVPFVKQDTEKLVTVYAAIANKFPIFTQYEDNWVAVAFVHAALKNSPRQRKQV